MRKHINYTSSKRYFEISADTNIINSDCTSIVLENQGEVIIFIEVEGTKFKLRPGAIIENVNDPDVQEITRFENIVFDPDGTGEKLLLVIKETVSPIE